MLDAIVLAAGLGTRMGRIKPLIRIGSEPALGLILRRLLETGSPSPIVVLGRTAQQIRAAVDLAEANVVVNPCPEQGMAGSLRLGLRAVSDQSLGAMVLLADMPFVRASTIRTIIRAAEKGARIAAPTHLGQRGFPVYFARECFTELLDTLEGDTGARDYLARHATDLVTVAVVDEGCIRDFDTPDDLPRTKETLHALHEDR